MPISVLPIELLTEVIAYVDPFYQIYSIQNVCHLWQSIVAKTLHQNPYEPFVVYKRFVFLEGGSDQDRSVADAVCYSTSKVHYFLGRGGYWFSKQDAKGYPFFSEYYEDRKRSTIIRDDLLNQPVLEASDVHTRITIIVGSPRSAMDDYVNRITLENVDNSVTLKDIYQTLRDTLDVIHFDRPSIESRWLLSFEEGDAEVFVLFHCMYPRQTKRSLLNTGPLNDELENEQEEKPTWCDHQL